MATKRRLRRASSRRPVAAEIDHMLRAMGEDIVEEDIVDDVTLEDELDEEMIDEAMYSCDMMSQDELEVEEELEELEAQLEEDEVEAEELEVEEELEELEAQLEEDEVEASRRSSRKPIRKSYRRYAEDEEDEDDEDEVEEEIKEVEAMIRASEAVPGIEDDILDTGEGGDPTVQEVTDSGDEASKEVESDKQVFPTNSDAVQAKRFTNRLDRVATILEKSGRKDLALRIDKVSDRIERGV